MEDSTLIPKGNGADLENELAQLMVRGGLAEVCVKKMKALNGLLDTMEQNGTRKIWIRVGNGVKGETATLPNDCADDLINVLKKAHDLLMVEAQKIIEGKIDNGKLDSDSR